MTTILHSVGLSKPTQYFHSIYASSQTANYVYVYNPTTKLSLQVSIEMAFIRNDEKFKSPRTVLIEQFRKPCSLSERELMQSKERNNHVQVSTCAMLSKSKWLQHGPNSHFINGFYCSLPHPSRSERNMQLHWMTLDLREIKTDERAEQLHFPREPSFHAISLAENVRTNRTITLRHEFMVHTASIQ